MQLTDGHVMTCLARECGHNCNEECCTPRIQIGDEHPMCDMYTTSPAEKVSHDTRVAQCVVDWCHFNASNECHAAGITLMHHGEHADCATFRV